MERVTVECQQAQERQRSLLPEAWALRALTQMSGQARLSLLLSIVLMTEVSVRSARPRLPAWQ